MEVIDPKSLFEMFPGKLFYVGFLRSDESWFPLCSVSDPREVDRLDTLFVSRSYAAMEELLKGYAEKIPKIQDTFIQFLMREEIESIMHGYCLKAVALTAAEESGCGCGCGCGSSSGDRSLLSGFSTIEATSRHKHTH